MAVYATITAEIAARFFPRLSRAGQPRAWRFRPDLGVAGAWEHGGTIVDDRVFSRLGYSAEDLPEEEE